MTFQKPFFTTLLAAMAVAVVSIGQTHAEQPIYPPMRGMDSGAMPPPPVPAYNGGNQGRYYPPQNQSRYQQGAPYRGPVPYGRPAPYGRPMPYAGGAPYQAPYGARPGPWNNGGWNRGPWNNGGNNGFGNWFGGNRGPYGNNSPMGNMFGRNGIWGMHPDEWMTSDPEDGFSYMWDDMINAPSEMGEMPGGWNAPSISMPNPVDVGSEFRREAPNFAREIPDMINVN